MKRYFTKTQRAEIKEKFETIGGKTDDLVIEFTRYPFTNEKARQYACHGFSRRVQTLKRCVENVFKAIPPSTAKVPVKTRLYDAGINLQAFVWNAHGCLDNLAWMWVHECGMAKDLSRRDVGLRSNHKRVRASLSPEFRAYLEKLDDKWLAYLTEYRDALAHRIPLYVPPGGVPRKSVDAYNDLTLRMKEAMRLRKFAEWDELSRQQDSMLVFQPLMTHSVDETKAHFAFHAQLIADFLTIEEVGMKMLAELRRAT